MFQRALSMLLCVSMLTGSVPNTAYATESFVVEQTESMEDTISDETEVEVTLSQNNVVFKFDNCVIVACLMSGEYIKYEQFIPKESEISIKMDRRLITQTVERASIIINYDDSRLPIILDIDGGVMSVDCVSKKGNFHEEIEIEQTATSLQIGLGSKFFLDALKASSGDDIIMEFSNAKSPLVIRPTEGDDYFYMVLPREFKR